MSLLKSVATVSGWTTVSRVLGFVRDMFIARFLGASMMADSFFVALRFPNLFRSLFAEGAFNVAFVPLFSEILHKQGRQKAKNFAREVFFFMFYLLLFFVFVIEILMPCLMFIMAPGFGEIEGKLALTTLLSRITFPFLLCVSLVSVLSGMLNSVGKFWAPAFVPVILNVMMILSLLVLAPVFPEPFAPAMALSFGVFLAGVIELIFLWWYAKRNHLTFGFLSPIRSLFHVGKHVKELLKKMLPGVLGAGVYQINLFLDTFFVSFVGAGAMSWLNYANHLFQLPIGIIGVALGTALLPVLSHHIKAGDERAAHEQLNRAVELSVLMSFSSMIGLLTLSFPIVVLLFQRGLFTPFDSAQTANALMIFAVGLPAYMMTKTLSPLFYARGDTKTPVKIAVLGIVLNSLLAVFFMQFWGYKGIALATSLTAWVNALQYVVRLKKENKFHLDSLCQHKIPRIIFSCLLMGIFILAVKYVFYAFFPDWLSLSLFKGIILLGALISCGGCILIMSLLCTHSYSLAGLKGIFKRS